MVGNLGILGEASNEKRNQRIIKLRDAFNDERINTVQQVAKLSGYTVKTVAKWAQDGNIPLLDEENGATIVPLTKQNQRSINEKRQLEHINYLSMIFNKQEAITVAACAQKMNYPEETIIAWAREGDVPLLVGANETLVPLNDTNTPAWL
ncbi:hypothetical protein FC65_GL001771 [Ligilactobacillus acidipiscis DSM 15836]|jgi:hypothetical protein|uniref:Uncharacterized protein n=2 Tax=Ligilactobacillus acidipiscis TaxID=89059 RepID=A0A0R2JRT9_9LACO|nr:hypothetical protein [Ligilactobacillus acidipiscis]KRM28115.1 hypothetical protein FC65_GL001771 [Ligilactobacillus acidipiscis DSM 15836]KRN79790.1 hypothetical protein IV43_GL000381 [Ligilactobacillus acidipiscis]SFV41451.1 hypothetical protein LAC1533_2028 [Ligilactobacillus acidipiscis]GAW64668.1 hypothetical protein Lacidipiscis_01872 [Ligilactobacillus acidipiscis]GEN21197.1 hypothetical protein LAC02_44780 [Ligilactobacillus acidipiscis]